MNRKIIFALLGIGLGIAAACGGKKEDTAECKSMRAEVAAQEVLHKEQVEATRLALTAALVAMPVASKEPCAAENLDWQKRTTISGGSLEGVDLPEPFYLGRFKSEASESICPMLGNLEGTRQLFQDEVDRMKTGTRLHFIDAERVSPELLDGKSYKGGHVRGRLLVWSYAEKRFVCTSEGHAKSGDKLYTTTGGVKSSEDLDDHNTGNAVRNAIEGLRQIDFDAKPVPFAEAMKGGGDAASMAKIHDFLRDGKKINAVKEYRAVHEVPLAAALLAIEVEMAKMGLPSKENVRNLYWDGKRDEAKAELRKLYGTKTEAQSSAALAAMKDELGPATEENFKAKLASKKGNAALQIYHRLHPELSIAEAHRAVEGM